ncbi:MAG: tRNA (N6-isopentenyl adenosine(37)-C2)-methylthiotransferase MiaB [Clostridia bacterium]|nr:tRNA (N6-isopentenyl adenosine(37)-C2)-methylthiotransferase MiaB [Clostridia bacterium]
MTLLPEKNTYISSEELARQREFCTLCRELLYERFGEEPKAFVHTYGCQGNVADSERIKGQLAGMGFTFCETAEEADFVLFNTCAVREHAEARVFGNVGALKPIKESKNNNMIIALCGCMMQQEHIAEKIRKSYDYVNLVFGTFAVWRLPELMYDLLRRRKRVFDVREETGRIAEGIPTVRDRTFRAWLPIMYGCNNFCTYCIVPYVRGRERSRTPENVIAEAKELIASGAKEITLLGQNVNSYGKMAGFDTDFPKLLREINALSGDFIIRFMTSHPKDCSEELLLAMAECEKVERHLHLPFQSGSDRILKAMNRGYTAGKYRSLVQRARELMPRIELTSDVIVGFPGETREDFEQTLSLIKDVGFTSLFTFIYSPRKGTPAASMEDPVSDKEKGEWFRELLKVQEEIAADRCKNEVGKRYRVLIEDFDGEYLAGRTSGNVVIKIPSADGALVGEFAEARVTHAGNWTLSGEIVKL